MSNSSDSMSIRQLAPAIGAVIDGVDLSQKLDKATMEQIHQALLTHQVIFFPKQTLTPEQHRDFAKMFGQLHIHPIYPSTKEAPEIIALDTNTKNPPDSDNWHTDVTFIKTPPMGAVLMAKMLPPCGGDTSWSSNVAAYDALSEPFRRFLDGLTAEHDFQKAFTMERYADGDVKKWNDAVKDNPPTIHPVVRVHPVTGKKGLFVNSGFTTRIVELSKLESDMVLEYLFAHAGKPEFTVRWKWSVGDVAFWDNRLTQHYALADYLPHRRIMHRATILGDEPKGLLAMADSAVPTLRFSSGNTIPVVGLGTWKAEAGQAKQAVKEAIDVGYRHFDCAYCYENEDEIGEALQEKMTEGVVKREDLFITSKLWSTYMSEKKVEEGFRKSLKALKLDYLDLYLIHWPVAYQEGDDDYPADQNGRPLHTGTDYLETWKAMEKLHRCGQIKDIGVSNFSIEQLQRLIDNSTTVPACNQIEVHVYLQNKELVDYCKQQNIIVVAYSPLGSFDRPKGPLYGEYPPPLEDAEVAKIAQKHGKQPGHVLLRFLTQQGLVVIPKSVNKNRMKSNLEVFDFELDVEDITALQKLDRKGEYRGCTMASDQGHKNYPFERIYDEE